MEPNIFLPPTTLGKVSESLALAICLAKGYQVALPFGNQSGWDFLALPPNSTQWLRIQVKTVTNQSIGLSHGSSRNGYTSYMCDVVMGVDPRASNAWWIGIEECENSPSLVMRKEWEFHKGCEIVYGRNMVKADEIGEVVGEVETRRRNKQKSIREWLAGNMPNDRPVDIPEVAWDWMRKVKEGVTYVAIGDQYGKDYSTVKEKVERWVGKLKEMLKERQI